MILKRNVVLNIFSENMKENLNCPVLRNLLGGEDDVSTKSY